MLIHLDNIERVYRKGMVDIFALRKVNLVITEGEFTAIMGPSGSGKSTLLHILGCLDRPSKGSYQLDGIDTAELNDTQLSSIRNQKIGFIFQSFDLLSHHTVLQNIEAPLLYSPKISSDILLQKEVTNSDFRSFRNSGSLSAFTEHSRKERVQAIAEQVRLGERFHHLPSELSGGEMQRVAIARALINEPRVILADEPTGNLDSRTGQEIMNVLRTLHEQGHTIIVVTHEQAVADYAEKIIFLKDGEIEREERNTPLPPSRGDFTTPFPLQRKTQYENSPLEEGQGGVLPHENSPLEEGRGGILPHENSPLEGEQGSVPPHENSLLEGGQGGVKIPHKLPVIFCLLPTAITTAIHGVLLHKLRSLLSILGIVFGIGAIIAMLAIGAGAKQEIIEQIALLGTNTITIRAVTLADDMVKTGKEQLSQGLTFEDVAHIAKVSSLISSLAAVREFSSQIQYQRHTAQARIVGTSPDYLYTGNLSIRQGRFLTSADEQEMQRVCVLGAEIQQELFPSRNPVGEMVKIRNNWFSVIGTLDNKVLDPKKISAIHMKNINKDVYIPLSTSSLFVPSKESRAIQEISIRVDTPEHVDNVARLIRTVLTRLHYGAQDYEVIVPRELLKQSQQAQDVFNLVMGCIAGISLLVGGIGIMNIMLATVTERTREIGVRRAIGASRRMILLQFLVEAVLLTFVGGCLGILLGIGGAYLISIFAQWRTIISVQTIVLAFSVSTFVGIIFGLYPASQGANMDPIAALRYE